MKQTKLSFKASKKKCSVSSSQPPHVGDTEEPSVSEAREHAVVEAGECPVVEVVKNLTGHTTELPENEEGWH